MTMPFDGVLPKGYTIFDLINGIANSFANFGIGYCPDFEGYYRIIDKYLIEADKEDLPKLRESRRLLNIASAKTEQHHFIEKILFKVKKRIIELSKPD